jgi:hypothetical protein
MSQMNQPRSPPLTRILLLLILAGAAAAGAGESGEQDPGRANQLGVVVVYQQQPIQTAAQGRHGLGP